MSLEVWRRVAYRIVTGMMWLVPKRLRQRSGADMAQLVAARLADAATRREIIRETALELWGFTSLRMRRRENARASMQRLTSHENSRGNRNMMDEVRQNLSFALRSMRRRPALAVLSVMTFGLGIGGTAAMFSVVDSVLLKPLPYENPQQIVSVYPTIEEWRTDDRLREDADRTAFSFAEYEQWSKRAKSFSAVAAFAPTSAYIGTSGGAVRIPVGMVSPSMFSLLGVSPAMGRAFDGTEQEPVVVISDAFWRIHQGADPNIIGKSVVLGRKSYTVTGVMPPGFEIVGTKADVWRPLDATVLKDVRGASYAGNHNIAVLGRLRPGVTTTQAAKETVELLGAVAPYTSEHEVHHLAHVVPRVDDLTADVRTPLLLLTIASFVLLIVACANVALLLLSAGSERWREIAVRNALGAARGRILAQLITETLVLSAFGGAVGIAVAVIATKLLAYVAPSGIPRFEHIAVDWRSFSFAALVAMLTGLLAGIIPALSLSRVRAAEAYRAHASSPRRNKLQGAIAFVEVALAVVLLVGAGLLTRTMRKLGDVQPGFDAVHTIGVGIAPQRELDDKRRMSYMQDMQRAIEAVPGVESVAMTSLVPYSGAAGSTVVDPEGYVAPAGATMDAEFRFVSGSYFTAMGIRASNGRALTDADDRADAEPVMVVTSSFARQFWPGKDPVGKRVGLWGSSTYRVVGVIPDILESDVRGETGRKFFIAVNQAGWLPGDFIVRTAVDSRSMIAPIRAALLRADPTVAIPSLETMRDKIDDSIASYRYRMRLMLAFAVMAAGFVALGIYGITSRGIASREREFGIRSALGAERSRIITQVLRESVLLGAGGVAAGILVAALAAQMLRGMVWGVSTVDPVTFVMIPAVILLLIVGASAVPAGRAARVDPMRALRS